MKQPMQCPGCNQVFDGVPAITKHMDECPQAQRAMHFMEHVSAPELVRRVWDAISERAAHWETKATETANKHDADYALGISAGLRMAHVILRRVRDGEEPNDDLKAGAQ